MTERLFELRQSNKLAAKILVAFFVIALAMVMAFAPPVETVALANEVNQVCAAVGVIVAAVKMCIRDRYGLWLLCRCL